MPDTLAFALADSAREETKLIKEFLESVGRLAFVYLPNYISTDIDNVLRAGFLRTLAHLRSVYKMNEPADFQSICGISRSLFEIVVDFVLITRSSQDFPVTQLLSWEDSARLKHAETMKAYYDANPLKKNDRHWLEYPKASKELCEFIINKGPVINANRRIPGKPDSRWTGCDLRQAAEKADKVSNYELEQYYILRHSPLCWDIHGSGLVGVKHISEETFPAVSAFAFHDCAELTMMIAELIMAEYKITDALEKNKIQLKTNITSTKMAIMSGYPNTFQKMFGRQ